MVRRILSFLLLVVMLLSLVACTEPVPAPGTDGSDGATASVSASEEGAQTSSVTDTGSADVTSTVDTDTDTDTEISSTFSDTHVLPEKPTKVDPQAVLESSEHLVLLTDQKNKRILLCDLAVEDWSKDKAVVWKYSTYGGVAGIKVRDSEYWGERVILICSGTRASIVSYKNKKMLLDLKNGPGNSHSVELLPNGVFVVAGSTGNEVRIYGAGKTTVSDKITFPSAHGVLWDPKYNVLWIAGSNQLEAFRVTGTAQAPKLEPVENMKYRPNTSLHDLAPVYGNPDALLLTGASGVTMFDKTTGKVSFDYTAGGYLKTQSYVPGVGNYGDTNVYVFTTIREDTLTYKEWGTDRVAIFVPTTGAMGRVLYRQAKTDAYYKVRVWNPAYQ